MYHDPVPAFEVMEHVLQLEWYISDLARDERLRLFHALTEPAAQNLLPHEKLLAATVGPVASRSVSRQAVGIDVDQLYNPV